VGNAFSTLVVTPVWFVTAIDGAAAEVIAA